MKNVKRIAKNSLFQVFSYAAKALSTFVVYIMLARLSGAELLGNFAVVITLIGLFSFVAAFGLPALLTRELSRQREDTLQYKRFIGASFLLVILLSLCAMGLLILTALFLNYSGELLTAVMLAGLALALESLSDVVASAFRSVEKMEWSETPNIIMEIVFLFAALIILLGGATLVWLMAAYVFSRLVALGAAMKLYQSQFGRLKLVVSKDLAGKLLKAAFPFSVNDALALVYVRLDVILLSFFTSGITVGIYEAATSLTIRVNLLARVLNLSLYPFLSMQFGRNKQSVSAYTARSIHYLFIPGFLITVILWVFAREILVLLYGPGFEQAVNALRYMALIIPLRLMDNSLAVALTATDRQGYRSVAVAVAAVTNVALNLILIPVYQMMAAVYSTIITEIVLAIFFIWYLRHEILEIIQWRTLWAPALGSLLFLLITLVRNANLWLLSAIAVMAYGVVIILLDRSSLDLLRVIFSRAPRENPL